MRSRTPVSTQMSPLARRRTSFINDLLTLTFPSTVRDTMSDTVVKGIVGFFPSPSSLISKTHKQNLCVINNAKKRLGGMSDGIVILGKSVLFSLIAVSCKPPHPLLSVCNDSSLPYSNPLTNTSNHSGKAKCPSHINPSFFQIQFHFQETSRGIQPPRNTIHPFTHHSNTTQATL